MPQIDSIYGGTAGISLKDFGMYTSEQPLGPAQD